LNLKGFVKRFSRLWVAMEADQGKPAEIPVGELQRICGLEFKEDRIRFPELTLRNQAATESDQGGRVSGRQLECATRILLGGYKVEARGQRYPAQSPQRVNRLWVKGERLVGGYSRSGISLVDIVRLRRVTHGVVSRGNGKRGPGGCITRIKSSRFLRIVDGPPKADGICLVEVEPRLQQGIMSRRILVRRRGV